MRKLIIQEWISIDGYATDRDYKLDFFVPTVRDLYADEYYLNFLNGIDCILLGRKTYQQFVALWPDRSGDILAEKVNNTLKIVFTKSLDATPWGKWNPAVKVTEQPLNSIRKLKSSEGKNIVIWGSLSLAQLAMKESIVDEYHLHFCPIITGGGRKLLIDGLNTTLLTLKHSMRFDNGLVSLHYQVKN